MPLHGRGLKRPGIFRVALIANDLLSCGRNYEVRPERQLPSGGTLSAAATAVRRR
jgi:hypothetical protein